MAHKSNGEFPRRALFVGFVPFTQMETRHFPAELPTSPHTPKTDRRRDCHSVALTSSTDTRFSGMDTSRWEPRDARQQWGLGREEAARMPLGGGVPAVSAGENTFPTGDESPRTGCGDPEGLSDGVTFHLGPINNSVGRMQKPEMGATKLHTWGADDRAEIGSCRVAGWVRRGPEWGEIINSTRSILYPTLCALVGLRPLPAAAMAGSGAGGSRPSSLGGTGVAARRETCRRGSRPGDWDP